MRRLLKEEQNQIEHIEQPFFPHYFGLTDSLINSIDMPGIYYLMRNQFISIQNNGIGDGKIKALTEHFCKRC